MFDYQKNNCEKKKKIKFPSNKYVKNSLYKKMLLVYIFFTMNLYLLKKKLDYLI